MPSPHRNFELEGELYRVTVQFERAVPFEGSEIDEFEFATIQPTIDAARERAIWMAGDAFQNPEIAAIRIERADLDDLREEVTESGAYVTPTIMSEVQEALSAQRFTRNQ